MTTISREPCNIIVKIDCSGSMAASIGAVDGAENNFSRMDLVKHSLRTIVGMLNAEDSLSIIQFSTSASISLNPTKMTDSNKIIVNSVIDSLIPNGNTNIYDAIQKTFEIVSRSENLDKKFYSLLLTDGYPNINPPRGILETLKPKPANLSMFTFGFGYDIDSKLLYELSSYGQGGFGFIPDCTMVGTIFINALAYIMSNNYVEELEDPIEPTSAIGGAGSSETSTIASALSSASDEFETFHSEYLITLNEVMTIMISAPGEAIRKLLTLFENYKNSSNTKVQEVLKDISSTSENEGQIGMAPKYASKWGLHYTRAYTRAQALKYTMNFKDPGLQIYSNRLFAQVQELGDNLFVSLPPPTPSIVSYGGGASGAYSASYTPIASMAVFHNASGGCFAPNSLVKMADNSYKKIQDIHPNDYVWTLSGISKVIALVKIGSKKPYQPMSNINKLWITPYHPVFYEGSWQFPANISSYVDRLMPVVYNLVLENGHIIDVDDILCVTLGHNLTDDVVKHDYFGTNKVIEDLKKLPGYDVGFPTFTNLKAIKNSDGIICQWIDDI